MTLKKIFSEYSRRDKIISLALLCLLGLALIFQGISTIFEAAEADSYTEGLVGELTIINPLYVDFNNINRNLSKLIYRGLTKYNPNTKTFEPDLAKEINVNKQATRYSFVIEDNIIWQDGQKFEVEDVYYTYKTLLNDPNFNNQILKDNFKGIEINILKDNEIEFVLPKTNAFFLSQTSIGILPKHIFENEDLTKLSTDFNEKLVIGNGPYKLEKVNKIDDNTSEVILKYNKESYKNLKIKTFRILIFKDENDLIEKQAELNAIPNISIENVAKLDLAKFKTSTYLFPQYNALFLNTETPGLNEFAVRKALLQGTNKNELEKLIPTKQIIGKPYFQFEEINEIGETQIESIKNALFAAGWILNDEKVREKGDTTLSFNLAVPNFQTNESKNETNKIVVEHLVNAYKEIGIKVVPSYYESETFARILNNKSFDMALYGHNLGNDFDSFSFWHSSQGGENGFNLSNYKSTAIDNLLEQLRSETNDKKRTQIILSLSKKLQEEAPAIFLYTDKHAFAFDNTIKNRKILTTYAYQSDIYYDITNWQPK